MSGAAQKRGLTRWKVAPMVSDRDLDLRYCPGTRGTMVLAFTGVDHAMPGLPMQEFGGTAAEGGANHVLFVADMRRTWFSAEGLVQRIVDAVTELARDKGIDRLLAIGNSMGAYGAILFAQYLPLRAVAAFSPQVSMDLSLVREKRWRDFRPNFGPALAPSLNPAIAATEAPVSAFFGADCKSDLRHRDLLAPRKNLHVFTLPGCHHNTAKHLKETGRLAPVARAALAGRARRVREVLAEGNPEPGADA